MRVDPREQPIENPCPCSLSASSAPGEQVLAVHRPSVRTTNSSPPMRYAPPRSPTAACSWRASRLEQRVAGGMAERVVVGLEAVEIEDADGDGLVPAERADHALHVGEQLAAVAEPGERVGGRVQVAAATRAERVGEGDREGGQQEHDGDDGADRRDGPRPGRVGAVRRRRPASYSSARRDSRPPGCWLAPSSSAACWEAPAPTRAERRSMKREVAPAQRTDARRRIAVAEPGERRDRGAEDELRLGQAPRRLRRARWRWRRRPDRRRPQAARPARCASAR